MNIKLISLLILIGGFSISTTLYASEPALEADASTLGAGVTVAAPLVEHTLNINAQFNGLSFHHDFTTSDVDYRGDVRLRTAGLVLKWFPFHGAFNFALGTYYDGNRVNVVSRPKQNTYTFNGHQYSASDIGSAKGKIRFNHITPYFGIGWGNTLNDGHLTVTARLGVLYQGSPEVTLSAPTTDPRARRDIAAEQRKLQNKLNDYKFYPVVGVALAYRF